MDLLIRPLALSEMSLPLDWAAAEGWNPGLHDAAPFHAADPEGLLCAFLDGQPAACVSVVRSGEDFGFLGFYICRPDLRGRGVGFRLWQAGLAHLAGRTVGLDGVVAQQENYRTSGFALAHRNVRYAGPSNVVADADAGVRAIDAGLLPAVLAYDRPLYGAPRAAFLARWLTPPEGDALALVEDGAVRGYGVIRPCRHGHKIGPLFADTPAHAERLFTALAGTVTGETIVLDPPEPNAEAVALAERYGLEPVFETARMYRGPAPELPLHRIFGITSFELG
jgi:hypothetical protein